MATGGGDAKLFARVRLGILIQLFCPFLPLLWETWHYRAFLEESPRIQQYQNLHIYISMSSYLTGMAGLNSDPGNPINPCDLISTPKLRLTVLN